MNKLKKITFLVLKLTVFLLAYIFIFIKLKNINLNNFKTNDYNYYYLIIAIILMIVNWSIEAQKLMLLLKDIQIISFKKALKSTIISIVFGLFTPNRLGEIPGKTVLLEKENRMKGTMATALGSFSQFIVTILLGIIGGSFIILFLKNNSIQNIFGNKITILLIVFATSLFIIYFNINNVLKLITRLNVSQKFLSKIKIFSSFKKVKLFQIFTLSFFRYLIFTLQFYLLLLFFNINLPMIIAFASIFSIYLLMNILPHFVIADLGIRGSISIFVIGQFIAVTPEIVAAPLLLWFINIVIPALVGQFFISKIKIKTQ